MWGLKYQWISHKMNNWQPWQLKKSKSWEHFWSYQPNSTADLANLAQFWGKWARLTVLFSWYLQNSSQDFHFFNCPGCWIFILCEIHRYFYHHIFLVYNFSLSQCEFPTNAKSHHNVLQPDIALPTFIFNLMSRGWWVFFKMWPQ